MLKTINSKVTKIHLRENSPADRIGKGIRTAGRFVLIAKALREHNDAVDARAEAHNPTIIEHDNN